MLRKLIIVSIISVFMLSAFTLISKESKAGTLPQVYWSDTGRVFVSVADLGTIFGNEWDIVVMNLADMTASWGLGFRFHNAHWREAVQCIVSDDIWSPEAIVYDTFDFPEPQPAHLAHSTGQSPVILTTTPPLASRTDIPESYSRRGPK